MNHTINDNGDSVIAVGAPGSEARAECEKSNKTRFKEVYSQALAECVTSRPDLYYWPVSQVDAVCARMFEAMDKGTFHHEGPAFKLTTKRLGIKPTRTAILAFWHS